MLPVDSDARHTDSPWDVPASFAEGHGVHPSIGPPPAPGVMNTDDALPLRAPSGAVARVRAGPFRGLKGVVADLGHPRRLILETRVLGRPVSIEVDASLLHTDTQRSTPVDAATTFAPTRPPTAGVAVAAPAAAAVTMTPLAALEAAAAVLSRTRKQVAMIINRRAALAGLSDAAYFREIVDGRAPRITRAEAASEAVC